MAPRDPFFRTAGNARDGARTFRLTHGFNGIPAGALVDEDHGKVSWRDPDSEGRAGRGKLHEFALSLQPISVFTPGEIEGWLGGMPFPEFRKDDIIQTVPVKKETFFHREHDSSFAFVPVETRSDNESPPNEVSATAGTTTETIVYHRLATFTPRITAAMAVYDLAGDNLRLVMRLMRMNAELETVGPSGILTADSGWATGHDIALGSDFQWGGPSGIGSLSKPIEDLFSLVHITPRGGVQIQWWMNGFVGQLILQHPEVQAQMRFKKGDAELERNITTLKEGGSPTGPIDFSLVGIGDFHIHTGQYQPTPSSALQYIMPNVAVANIRYPGIPTTGMELATAYDWELEWPGGGTGWNVRTVEMGFRGAGGNLVIVEQGRKIKKVGTNMGGLLLDVSA